MRSDGTATTIRVRVVLTARTAAALRADGVPADRADVAYALPLFPFLAFTLRFWRSDEDFPARLQFLADRSLPRFMHYETAMFAASHLTDRLTALMQ